MPNIESAAGLVRTIDIARAARNVTAALMASEDMVADLGAARTREGGELAYARARFLVECRAAGIEAIDCPYTFSDVARRREGRALRESAGLSREEPGLARARRRGEPRVRAVRSEIAHARRVVAAFEKARAAGRERATRGRRAHRSADLRRREAPARIARSAVTRLVVRGRAAAVPPSPAGATLPSTSRGALAICCGGPLVAAEALVRAARAARCDCRAH